MKTVTLQDSDYRAISRLPSNEQLLMFHNICKYALDKEEPKTLTPALQMAFDFIRPRLVHNHRRKENGKKGGRPKKDTPTMSKSVKEQEQDKPSDLLTLSRKSRKSKDLEEETKKIEIPDFINMDSWNGFSEIAD